jgi:hypothetical protein
LVKELTKKYGIIISSKFDLHEQIDKVKNT